LRASEARVERRRVVIIEHGTHPPQVLERRVVEGHVAPEAVADQGASQVVGLTEGEALRDQVAFVLAQVGVVGERQPVQDAEQARKTLAREPGFVECVLVLAVPRGGPWWPYNFDRMWRKFKAEQGLEIRFHDLRHSHATALLKAGIHPKVVSERLGHANIGITLDTYSHVMPGMQEEAAEKIDAGLRAALAG